MTQEEITEILNSKIESRYFSKPLLGSLTYGRRSFGDIYEYFKVAYNITDEKLIMKAIKDLGLTAYICEDIDKIVFHNFGNPTKLFWKEYQYINQDNIRYNTRIKDGKYTAKYLENLYLSV